MASGVRYFFDFVKAIFDFRSFKPRSNVILQHQLSAYQKSDWNSMVGDCRDAFFIHQLTASSLILILKIRLIGQILIPSAIVLVPSKFGSVLVALVKPLCLNFVLI